MTRCVIEDHWASHHCTVTFNTLGVWPQGSDGTDVNGVAVYGDILAAATDFGTVKLYRYL